MAAKRLAILENRPWHEVLPDGSISVRSPTLDRPLSLSEYKALIEEEAEWDDEDVDSDKSYGKMLREIAARIRVRPD